MALPRWLWSRVSIPGLAERADHPTGTRMPARMLACRDRYAGDVEMQPGEAVSAGDPQRHGYNVTDDIAAEKSRWPAHMSEVKRSAHDKWLRL